MNACFILIKMLMNGKQRVEYRHCSIWIIKNYFHKLLHNNYVHLNLGNLITSHGNYSEKSNGKVMGFLYCLSRITHDNSISIGSDLALGLCSRFQIFSTPFFSCMWWICTMIFCVCLPGMKNNINCQGKIMGMLFLWKPKNVWPSDVLFEVSMLHVCPKFQTKNQFCISIFDDLNIS